jgi:hypothetical protein
MGAHGTLFRGFVELTLSPRESFEFLHTCEYQER